MLRWQERLLLLACDPTCFKCISGGDNGCSVCKTNAKLKPSATTGPAACECNTGFYRHPQLRAAPLVIQPARRVQLQFPPSAFPAKPTLLCPPLLLKALAPVPFTSTRNRPLRTVWSAILTAILVLALPVINVRAAILWLLSSMESTPIPVSATQGSHLLQQSTTASHVTLPAKLVVRDWLHTALPAATMHNYVLRHQASVTVFQEWISTPR